jgi:predicted SnoaL-like aldol condensation-catalyzing enzyme
MSANKQHAIDFLKSLETGDTDPLRYIGRYRQHNLAIPDGIEGLRSTVGQLPEGSPKVRTVRAIEDGDYVITHSDYDFFGPKIGFDIFRFENGKIEEHWDNLQPAPGLVNPSGRSMIDGPTDIGNASATAENKALARAFVEEVLVHRGSNWRAVDGYLQHNPHIADGLPALQQTLDSMAQQGHPIEYDRIHRVYGEGAFALVVSEGRVSGRPTAFYDLFRIVDGRLAEHWDVLEPIPPRPEWKNDNGKF